MAANPNAQTYTNQRTNFVNSHSKLFGYNKTVDYSARAVKNNILASQDNVNMDLFYTQQITNPNMSWLLRHHGTEQPNLCVRGIMHGQEDFTFQISNDYSTGDESIVGQILGQVGGHVRELQKQSTLYNSRARLTKLLGNYADSMKSMAQEGLQSNELMDKIKGVGLNLGGAAASIGSKLLEGSGGVVNALSKLGLNTDRLMNSHFISAADVVRRYQGSTVQMNLPPLDVFIFHNSNMEAPNVIHMVQAIVQQCLGDLKDAEGVIGLQEAPGGYKAQFDNLNTEVRKEQVEGLKRLRANRDEAKVKADLEALTHCVETGEGNLLALAVEAAKDRASLGEISDACEKVVGRYKAVVKTISGVYSAETKSDPDLQKARDLTAKFAAQNGRQPRIMIAKMGQDGHDRGAKVVATGYADCGFDVDMGPLFQTPEEAAREAVENDVNVLGVSSLAAGHKTLIPAVIAELKKLGREDIIVTAGGVIPVQDYDFLYKAGVAAIFGPGTNVMKSAIEVMNILLDE